MFAFAVAQVSVVLAAPPGCINGVRWGWPGYAIGKNPWGVVLYPSTSSGQGDELVDVCLSSTVPASASTGSATVSTTSLSNAFVSAVTSTSTTSTSLTRSISSESSTTSTSLKFVTSTTPFEAPSTTSSTFEVPPTSSRVSDTASFDLPTEAPTPSTTTSSTPEPSPSSSSSEPSAPETTTNSFSSSPNNGDSSDGSSNGSQASDKDVNEYLSSHNSIRAQHGASPLTWNNTLAAAAQKWSDGCVFQHSGGSVGPFGENLAAGTGDAYGITSAVTSWTNEVSEYNPSSPSASHFTQVVWKGSTQLGCAETTCGGGTIFSDSSKFFVCEYFPQGNVIGAFAFINALFFIHVWFLSTPWLVSRARLALPNVPNANSLLSNMVPRLSRLGSWFGLVIALVYTNVARAAVNWTVTPFNPPAIPLAVKTPYLSAWLMQGEGVALNDAWPAFWTGSTLGWAGYVRVDGTTYLFLGGPEVPGATKAVQQSFEFTSTQSIFLLRAGPVDLTATFLSPVEPNDLFRQSVPFSYLSLSAASNDGNSHSVQIYTDISAEWVTGDNSLVANWSTSVGDIFTHQVQLVEQTNFAEIGDHIQQGSAFYSVAMSSSTTYQTGPDVDVRAQFINNGVLANTEDTNFRAVQDNWPIFGFAQDLGTVQEASPPVVFSVGHIRDPVIEYIIANNQTEYRSPYFLSQHATPADTISFFLGDYTNAVSSANALDAKVSHDASAISANYEGIVTLSVRQAFAATEITLSRNSDGTLSTDDVLIFLKEISSNGNMNTVDVIFPAWPIFLYTDPEYGRLLLEPLFKYQATGQYPNKYALHDLGAHYPRALGHNDGLDEAMPVEESGNMVIMSLSYTQATGDDTLISTYFDLLDQWTQFLINDSLIPANQLSTDDFAGHLENQTNLAIKGIIGIKAMSLIAGLLGDSARESNYSSITSDYVSQWQGLATASTGDHLTLSYGNDSSWGLSYNLYADRLLKTNIFPQSVYDMQTAWYKTVDNAFGVPLDTRHTYTKSDWEIWTAGLVSDTVARDLFIDAVKNYASSGQGAQPFGDWYETTNGVPEGFRARPVVGGHLALLVL
ncbi:hypothetical protein ACEPAF_3442 [Sanghuangporus sanghuang]